MPFHTDAYLADTRHLTIEEHGAYLLLLMCAWRSPGCRLPHDDKKLARMVGVSPAKWRKIKAGIIEFFTVEENHISQKKLTKIYKNVSKKVEQNRDNGKLGGRPKSLETNKPPEANGSVSLNPNETQTEPIQNQTITLTNVSDANAPDLLWTEGLKLVMELTGMRSEKSARSFIGKMLKQSSNKPRSVLEAIDATLAYREMHGGIAEAGAYMLSCLEKKTKPWVFNTDDPKDWSTFLGEVNSKFMRSHRENNWNVEGQPSVKIGPNPWRYENKIIPKQVRDVYGEAWRWQ